MSEDEGKKFLEMIDEQNNLQWSMVENLAKLIESNWDSSELKAKLESLLQRHGAITSNLNSLDNTS